MTPERTIEVLQQIADGVARGELHGNSLRSLRKRGLIRNVYDSDDGEILVVRRYLTKAGRELLATSRDLANNSKGD